METYTITILENKEILHQANYFFNNIAEAEQYKLGLFEGMRLAGANPTGMRIKKNVITKKNFTVA